MSKEKSNPPSPRKRSGKVCSGTEQTLDAERVAAYLKENPTFFIDRDELLARIQVPHKPAGAISLVERQLDILRKRNDELAQRLAQIMEVARENDRLFDKTRRLVLDLLDAGNLEEIVGALDDSLRYQFQVPYVSLILFNETPLPVGRSTPLAEAQKAIGDLLVESKSICGMLRPYELDFLFGEDARQIGSAAVSTIGTHGILAIGSPDPQHYKSSLGTLFIGYIAEALARVLAHAGQSLRPIK
ncbi:DUF484 family protein [Azomonas macrocytogenes]|uniref:DUF484 family protein n=1 Tax=Azomonas macrocytogenes TaxID=69962 RepID=A0A839T3P2_AZOMA|nr:DUF484 family protein [Azomonas macrocytogenes]MBB3103320.1 hypothetical protein [Azomonas macrocytogenes]